MVADNYEQVGIGHNNPPIGEVLAETHRELIAEVEPLAERANSLPRKIEDDEGVGPAGDLVMDAKKLSRHLDATRKAEKEPYLQGGRDVDAFFRTFTDRLDNIAKFFEGAVNDYLREKAAAERRAAEEEARKLREAEEKKRIEAEAAKRESTAARKMDEAEDIADQRWEAENRAKKAAEEAANFTTTSGTKVKTKTVWKAEILDKRAIPLDYLRDFLPLEVIQKALNEMAAKDRETAKCPGVRFYEDVVVSSIRR